MVNDVYLESEAQGCFEKEAAGIVNPDIEIRHTKLMTARDDYCETLFSGKKKSS